MGRPWLLLALGGVLLEHRPERCCDALAELSGLPTETVRTRIAASGIGERLTGGQAGPVELAAVLSELAGRAIDAEAAIRLWCLAYEPDLRTVLALPALAGTHRLGVFADEPPLLTRAINASLFERVLFPAELGARKPAPESFRAAARLLDAPPPGIVLVDTDPACLAAARDAGWQAVPFTGAATLVAQVAAVVDQAGPDADTDADADADADADFDAEPGRTPAA